MIRKALALIVLLCMTLHCANKLGLLSYLYANRSEIAVSLGLKSHDETIAVCNSDYFSDHTLLIVHDDNDSFPPIHIQSQEINLFFVFFSEWVSPDQPLLQLKQSASYQIPHYQSDLPSVFHPPAIV